MALGRLKSAKVYYYIGYKNDWFGSSINIFDDIPDDIDDDY